MRTGQHSDEFYGLSVGVGLYGLSIIVGSVGTGLTIALETKNTDSDSHLSQRALYSFILFLAGLLFQAARISFQSQVSTQSPDIPRSPSVSKDVSPDDSEEKSPLTSSPLSSSRSADIALLEFKPTPIKDEKVPEIRPLDEDKRVTEEKPASPSPLVVSCTVRLPIQAIPSIRWRCLTFVRDLVPATWWAQSLTLFLHNALEESAASELLPYTALAGLFTGYLFNICLNPWQLCGISRWIEDHRNELVIPEYYIYPILLGFQTIRSYFLFRATTASFWTGYNVEELVTLITTKLLRQSSSTDKNILHELPVSTKAVLPRWSTTVLTSLSGAGLIGFSLLTVQQTAIGVDQMALRNSGAAWMASIGNYAFSYPLGIYLGRYLPRRYHKKALIAATYLLVPFASPNLTIPHYILLFGAGLCGGVANFILKDQYLSQLAQMQQRKQLTDVLLRDTPLFLQLLSQVSLPDDVLLQRSQQKQKNMTMIIKVAIAMGFFSSFYFFLESAMKDRPLGLIFTNLIFSLGNILVYLGSFHLLTRWAPSIYVSTPLPKLQQFFYHDSFSLIFLLKIAVILENRIELFTTIVGDTSSNALLLNAALYTPVACLAIVKAFVKRTQGHQPYIPRIADIQQLATALKSESLELYCKSGKTRLSCSYYLLKFMQENPPVLLNTRILSSNDSSLELENKTLIGDQEDKLQTNQQPTSKVSTPVASVNSPSWSPSLLWRPLSKNNQPESKQGRLSVTVAELYEEGSDKTQLTLEADFSSPYDQSYTRQRLDISLLFRAGDAAVRGPSVAGQFEMRLPENLSLSSTIDSFRF